MSVEVSVDSAKKNLENILARLSPGETATLIGPEGRPMAVLVPLRYSEDIAEEIDWDEEWQALAQKSILNGRARRALCRFFPR